MSTLSNKCHKKIIINHITKTVRIGTNEILIQCKKQRNYTTTNLFTSKEKIMLLSIDVTKIIVYKQPTQYKMAMV